MWARTSVGFWCRAMTCEIDVRLARAGRAEEGLVADAASEPVGQPFDRRGLVAGRLERGDEAEVGHVAIVAELSC